MEKYILALKEPVTIEDIKPLIGQKINVLKTQRSWGKEEISTDELLITNVRFPVDVESGKSVGVIQVYSDYKLKGHTIYNAWNSLEGVKKFIQAYLDSTTRID